MKQCDMKHTPHECRYIFRSGLDSVGEFSYTHKTIKELEEAIEKLN